MYGHTGEHPASGLQPGDCSNAGRCDGRIEGEGHGWPSSPEEGISEALAGLHAYTSYQERKARQGAAREGQRGGSPVHGEDPPDAQGLDADNQRRERRHE